MFSKAFIVLFFACASASMGIGIILPILPVYASDMGASGLMIGLVFSSFAITKAITSPFFGRISDKTGRKKVIVIGLAVFTLVAIAFSLARNALDLVIVRCFMGVANAMVVPIIGAYVGSLAEKDHEAQYMAVFAISVLIGMGTGPLAGGLISELHGPPAAFLAMGLMTAIACVLAATGLPPHTREKKAASLSETPLLDLIAIPKLRGLIAFRFIDTVGVGGMMVFLPILIRMHGISAFQIGVLVSAIVCLSGLLQVPFGRIVDRTGKREACIVAGSLMSAFSLACLPFAGSFSSFLAVGLIAASGGALAGPASNALIVRESRHIGLGFSVSSFDSVQAAGFIAGPLLSGLVMDFLGVRYVFYTAAAIYLVGIGIFYACTKTIPSSSTSSQAPAGRENGIMP